jgi:tryptophan halogenase
MKDCELELYYDSTIKPQPVGEGSTPTLPNCLWQNLEFTFDELQKVDGNIKYGIDKRNWGGTDFVHPFYPPIVGYHFNAGKLQNFIFDKLKNDVKIIDKNVRHQDIDADFVMDCSGKPNDYEDFNMSEYISVNAVYVTQCYWDYPTFNNTLTIARPYGWVFGIPLKNRCSIGYMYNHNINTLEEVKEDVKNIFEEFNLTPSDTTNAFTFKNYFRKQNFTERVIYNGNSSFFLEPLEATSIMVMDFINRGSYDVWTGKMSANKYNQSYLELLNEIEEMIMIHYYAGSKFDTPFWDFAKERGERCSKRMMNNPKFKFIYEMSKEKNPGEGLSAAVLNYAALIPLSYKINLNGLNLYDKLDKLI